MGPVGRSRVSLQAAVFEGVHFGVQTPKSCQGLQRGQSSSGEHSACKVILLANHLLLIKREVGWGKVTAQQLCFSIRQAELAHSSPPRTESSCWRTSRVSSFKACPKSAGHATGQRHVWLGLALRAGPGVCISPSFQLPFSPLAVTM